MTRASRRWSVTPPPAGDAHLALTASGPGVGPLEALLLYNRGQRTPDAARRYLEPDLARLEDPFRLPDMDRAAQRVSRAIANGEKVGVYGDFDVDGLSATALLLHTIRDLGGVAIGYIPRRDDDGHGLSADAIAALHARGVSLLITVDTGSTDGDQIEGAAALGVDVVVTDHHRADAPVETAWANVNPQLGDSPADHGLTGAGVAFNLARALYDRSPARPGWPPHIVALAALGTVADSGPLVGDNRIIVSAGLRHLARTDHPGLAALLAVSGVLSPSNGGRREGRLDTEDLAFGLVPRLNAPGRLGDATLSLDLLTARDPAAAADLAGQIDRLNSERRRLSGEAWDLASRQLAAQAEVPPLIVVRSDGLNPGLLGPLAGRLCGDYGRPAVAISVGPETARASARSTPGFDIHAALEPNAGGFLEFGGHARAAGFTVAVDRLEAALDALRRRASLAGDSARQEPDLAADAELGFRQLPDALWRFVDRLAPFGEGNPAPVFISRRLAPSNVRTMGSGGDHLRLVVEDGGLRRDAIGFRLGRAPLGGGLVDIAYSLRVNHWRGRTSLELGLLDIRPSQP